MGFRKLLPKHCFRKLSPSSNHLIVEQVTNHIGSISK